METYWHSEYMSYPLHIEETNKRAHRIQMHLKFADNGATGSGTFTFNPNECKINEFGDMSSCTKMNLSSFQFTFAGIKLADPLKLGRSIYEIDIQETSDHDVLFMVLPGDGTDDARLIYHFGLEDAFIVYLKPGPFPTI